jgi:hypothetical protein
MMTPAEQYKYDPKFRQIVDILRNELMCYEFTPAELRQAVILAATMHADQNIKPLIYIDEAKLFSLHNPALFGGLQGYASGRFQSSKPNFTKVDRYPVNVNPEGRIGVADRRDHSRNWLDNPRGKWGRYQAGYAERTGDRRKPHSHKFEYILKRDYRVCKCGISDVYYNSTFETKTATGSNL